MHDITVVGPGRLGGSLALALFHSGYKISQVIYRSRRGAKLLASKIEPSPTLTHIQKVDHINGGVILICVPDDEITNSVRAIAPHAKNVRAVFHTSGSLSSEILAPLRSPICSVASLHPLMSVSDWKGAESRFKDAFFCVEGDAGAVKIARKVVSRLGGASFSVRSDHKSLYHAAALTAAGQMTALFDIAVGFMVKAGVKRSTARKLLQPLLTSVADNLARNETAKALTGTYARGDIGTMNRHLSALRQNATNEELSIYINLALRSIDLAVNSSSNRSKLESMQKALIVAKHNIEC